MTTHPPTGEVGGAVPEWFPDEATLTRLANEFFGNMPGHDPDRGLPADSASSDGSKPRSEAAAFKSDPAAPASSLAGVSGYLPPDAVSSFHRATSAPGKLASLAVQPAASSVPGLPLGIEAAILGAARPDGLEMSHLAPVGQGGAQSFYFIDERPARPGPAPVCDRRLAGAADAYPAFHVEAVRRDFPVLQERVHGRQLVWLDNGATTQKPQVVIDRLAYFYSHENSNIHRSAHTLAARSSDAYEGARATVADFLRAPSAGTIVFTRGTTEAINLVAQSWGRRHVGPDDEILISHLEHHANIVPWQPSSR